MSDLEQQLANRLYDENMSRKPFSPVHGDLRPPDLAAAYRVQDLLNARYIAGGRGPVAGYKIGLTSEKIRQMYNVREPISGIIYSSTVHRSPAQLKLGDFMHLGIEFELAVEIARDVPSDALPLNIDTVREFIAACIPSFELIEDRNADHDDLDALSIVVDNGWCGGIVLGETFGDWKALDFASNSVVMYLNGEFVEDAVTGDAMGHPFNSITWLADLLARQGKELKAGDIVLTGSTLATHFPEPGDKYLYEVKGLGSVSAEIY